MSSEIQIPEQKPEKEKQEIVLAEMQATHMQKIIGTPNLLDSVVTSIKNHTPEAKLEGDAKVIVSKSKVGSRQSDGTWEDRENLEIRVAVPAYFGGTVQYIATVGKRVENSNGEMVVTPNERFELNDALLVSACIDELELARVSGQIPDLSIECSGIYIPQPASN